ncbi:MAG: hypothetical protein AAFV53_35590, partial [Myxococcota bacterium]
LCSQDTLLSGNIPKDSWTRGSALYHQPRAYSAMAALAFEGICGNTVEAAITANRPLFPVKDPEWTLDLMVSEFMGIPEGTDEYIRQRDILQNMFDVQTIAQSCADDAEFEAELYSGDPRCGLNLSEKEALGNIWVMVCQSPSLTGVGI